MELQVISFETVASEVFQIIRSFDYTAKMYNDDGNQVYEPEEARRFFILPDNMLLSLIDDGDDSSIKLYLSKSTRAKDIEGLIDTLRITATKYNMVWYLREKDTELKPSDFATKASVTESREAQMNIFEGMYGTSRSSYLKLENARMIVRHSKKINENTVGSRGRNVDHIFIENAQGERMLFPTRQLLPARAELQHVNQGGNFNDAISQQIMRMANDFSNLSFASTEIASAAPMLGESAMGIREACRCKISEMKKCFERLSRPFGYKMESQRMNETVLTENEDQSLDISPLKEALTCEGFELSESVLLSIAEAVKSVALSVMEPVEEELEPWMGKDIDTPAYLRKDKYKKDVEDSLGGGPKLKTVKDEHSEVEEGLSDYKRKPVQGLYDYDHFEHPDGSFIQIRGGKQFKAVHQDAQGNRKEFDNFDDLKNHINEGDEDYSDEEEPNEKPKNGSEQVSILGKSVDKSAWEELLSGKLDLIREPDTSVMPRFTNDENKTAFMLSKIVPYIKNNSMCNLLSYFSDMIENPRLNPDARKKMNMVISIAIKNAKVPEEETDLVNNEVIREFNEWMEQFDILNVIVEDEDEPKIEYLRHVYTSPRMNDSSEAAKNAIFHRITHRHPDLLSKYGPVKVTAAIDDEAILLDDLEEIGSSDVSIWVDNVSKSLEYGNYDHLEENEECPLEESEPYEGEEELQDAQVEVTDDFDVNDFLNDYGDELYWDQGKFDTTGLEDEDLKFEKSYVKGLVQHYLEAQVYDKTGQDVDMKDFVQYVWDKVEPLLTDAGHILTEFFDDSITFSHTDIIIPTNQGDDLEREVTKPSSTDAFTGQEVPVDDDYISRMRTLAGMPWNR